MNEIQVYEGDGSIPPEMAKLIRENEELHRKITDLRDRIVAYEKERREHIKKINNLTCVVMEIENVMNRRAKWDDESPDGWNDADQPTTYNREDP